MQNLGLTILNGILNCNEKISTFLQTWSYLLKTLTDWETFKEAWKALIVQLFNCLSSVTHSEGLPGEPSKVRQNKSYLMCGACRKHLLHMQQSSENEVCFWVNIEFVKSLMFLSKKNLKNDPNIEKYFSSFCPHSNNSL